MLASLELSHILLLVVFSVLFFIAGYIISNQKQKGFQKNMLQLEQDMLKSHAEILRLQKELADKKAEAHKTPIVSITAPAAETTKENLPDGNLRKKVLTGGAKSNS
ncbi:MAG: hypothetical protein RLZZ316_1014 [Bacteroidota bacterium]|jgi:hypothetical protein